MRHAAARQPSQRATEMPIVTRMVKRVGIRAAPITGTYRSSAHGVGTNVAMPANRMNGPSDNTANVAVNAIHPAWGRRRRRRAATTIVATATQDHEATFSMNPFGCLVSHETT